MGITTIDIPCSIFHQVSHDGVASMHICVVHEDRIVASTLHDFLTDLGHDVLMLHGVDTLLEGLEKAPAMADIVIADLRMNNLNDVSAVKKAHERYPHIHIIAMDAAGWIPPPELALSCGIHAFIRKPIRFSELELMLIRLPETRARP